jgi:hypothetical protein
MQQGSAAARLCPCSLHVLALTAVASWPSVPLLQAAITQALEESMVTINYDDLLREIQLWIYDLEGATGDVNKALEVGAPCCRLPAGCVHEMAEQRRRCPGTESWGARVCARVCVYVCVCVCA